VVPHVYAENISVREIEFARRLNAPFRCLLPGMEGRVARRYRKRASAQVEAILDSAGSVFSRQDLRPAGDGVTYVTAPVLQAILLQRAIGRSGPLNCAARSTAARSNL